MNYYRDEKEVDDKLKRIMLAATDDVMAMTKEKSTWMRM
jgi:glutamate dehydrogenase/leucine dehydrogenase